MLTRKMWTVLMAGLFMIMATAGSAAAATKNSVSLNHQDKQFAEKAAMGNMMEVQLGKVAADRASSPQVKQFARKMVDNHSKALDNLRGITENESGVQVPVKLDQEHMEKIQKLEKYSGSKFDSEYMNHMVKDHKEDIKAFQKEVDKGQNPALQQYASQTLPELHQHLAMAKQIDQQVAKK